MKVGAPVLVVLLLIAAFAGGSALGRSEETASVEATASPEPAINSPSPPATEETTETPTPITPAPKTPTPSPTAKTEPTATPAPTAAPTPTPAPTSTPTAAPTPTPTVEPTPTPTTEPTLEPTGPKTTFGDGTHLVNIDIAPGTYVAPGGKDCFWERKSEPPDEEDDVIANQNPVGRTIVTIEGGDKTFETGGCGEWTPAPTSGKPKTSFGPGAYAVGVDIKPGTYKAVGGAGCYWARLKGFGGTEEEIIADSHPEHSATVTIRPTDKGFLSEGCGDWKK